MFLTILMVATLFLVVAGLLYDTWRNQQLVEVRAWVKELEERVEELEARRPDVPEQESSRLG